MNEDTRMLLFAIPVLIFTLWFAIFFYFKGRFPYQKEDEAYETDN